MKCRKNRKIKKNVKPQIIFDMKNSLKNEMERMRRTRNATKEKGEQL